MVQWLAPSPSDWKVASSNPGLARSISIFFLTKMRQKVSRCLIKFSERERKVKLALIDYDKLATRKPPLG